MKPLWIIKYEIRDYFELKKTQKMQNIYDKVVKKVKNFGNNVNLEQITEIRDAYIRHLVGEYGEIDIKRFIGEELNEESLLKKLMFGISENENYMDYCPNLFEIKSDRISFYRKLNEILPEGSKLSKKELEFVLSEYAPDFICFTRYDDKGEVCSYKAEPVEFDLALLLEMVDNKFIEEKPEVYRILCQIMKLENNMRRKTPFVSNSL